MATVSPVVTVITDPTPAWAALGALLEGLGLSPQETVGLRIGAYPGSLDVVAEIRIGDATSTQTEHRRFAVPWPSDKQGGAES